MTPRAEVYEHPITAYRRRHELTLEAMGARCKPPIAKSTLSRIESGLRKPSFDVLQAIVSACGGEVTADEIIRATPREVAA